MCVRGVEWIEAPRADACLPPVAGLHLIRRGAGGCCCGCAAALVLLPGWTVMEKITD